MRYKIIFVENAKLVQDENGKSWLEAQLDTGGDLEDYDVVNISWNGPSALVVLKEITE